MIVNQFQKAAAYIREIQEMVLFATMADEGLAATFRASPLFYLILPFIGLLLTINMLINGYQLAKASNRNFDRWFLFIISMVSATLASISLYGSVISMALGLNFIAGPWLFLSGTIGALSHQLVMFGINLYRASESPKGSIQSIHYIQAALNNLFAATLLTAAIGTILFAMLFPIAPVVGSICAITAVVLTVLNLCWRVIPDNGKRVIKGWLYLNKPDLEEDARINHESLLKPSTVIVLNKEPQHHRLFTCYDYSALIRNMGIDETKNYLLKRIYYKLNSFEQNIELQDEKTKDKIFLLKKLLQAVTQPTELSKKKMLEKYPLAFQSFWMEKGEVEQLFDAVLVLQKKYHQNKEDISILEIGTYNK